MAEIQKFVDSPFVNQRAHVSQLFVFLRRCKYEWKILPEKKAAFDFLFPDRTFDDHKLRLSISLLYKALEKYLVWRQFSKSENETKIKLAQAYRELNLFRHFSKTVATLEKEQSKQLIQNADYYQMRYQFFTEQYLFNKEQRRMAENLKLEQVQENLDIAYLSSKLRQSCFSLAHQTIYNKEYSYGMLPEVMRYVEQNDYLNIPAISVYYYYYKALTGVGYYDDFIRFKELIIEHLDKFPKDEIRDLLLLAANYCIRKMNRGEKKFAREGLDIYKVGLKNDILLLNGVLSHFTYRNIVAKAIVCKTYDWAEQFIQQYKHNLAKPYQESTFSFNLAWLEYERKNYNRALDLLHKANFSDVLLNISAKTIAMKIFFELESFDLLYSHLDAMKTFLNRKKIIVYHKKNYLNTIKYTKKILDLAPSDVEKKTLLRKTIAQEKVIAEKTWLLKQLGEK